MLIHPDSLHLPSKDLSRVRFPPLYIVLLEQDDHYRKIFEKIASGLRFIVSSAKDAVAARALFKRQTVNILLVDPSCRADHGYPFIEEVKHLHPDTEIVAVAPEGSSMNMMDAMQLGAIDYLIKPIDPKHLAAVLERTRQQLHAAVSSRRLRERLRSRRDRGMLVGQSRPLQSIRQFVSSVANSTHPVLILGEMGSGKKLVAQSIHLNSDRASKSFIRIECNSLSPALHGSELFGHEKLAFREADSAQSGLLAAAESGTVLLDEITDLSVEMQSALLQALRRKMVSPIGSSQSRPISVRVLATTSRDIRLMVDRGRFRKDLFSFLNVSSLRITPLRERTEDIPETVQYILDRISRGATSPHLVSHEVLTAMTQYNWPGNVRELEDVLEYACSRCSNGSLSLRDLPLQFQEPGSRAHADSQSYLDKQRLPRSEDVGPSIAEAEKRAIVSALKYTHGDKNEAAHRLGIGRTTLYRKLREYGLDEEKDDQR
ncbi:sigma-54-dependent transcriptional regulator [Edaphobacter bradus]|uniref:sigma-54-dependent transcriptional regulator n=1 Tax=Edaphobacter bradus TaxID=2259016 RepID=UPI0021E0FA5C|nr:sigma-54 dependent transcriptional regulator [Edaphobacter bradus]